MTRQMKRAKKRAETWFRWQAERAPHDEKGIIPRRIRRDIAMTLCRRKNS